MSEYMKLQSQHLQDCQSKYCNTIWQIWICANKLAFWSWFFVLVLVCGFKVNQLKNIKSWLVFSNWFQRFVLCISTSFQVLAAPESWSNYFFTLKKLCNEQKRLKTAEKSSWTSFQVLLAPESWSKYKTDLPFESQIQWGSE